MEETSPPGASALDLSGVQETSLFSLHNRAHEAMRPDGILNDPDALRLYRTIGYDVAKFTRSFGRPGGATALRSRLFEEAP